jgi:hypothetical protein
MMCVISEISYFEKIQGSLRDNLAVWVSPHFLKAGNFPVQRLTAKIDRVVSKENVQLILPRHSCFHKFGPILFSLYKQLAVSLGIRAEMHVDFHANYPLFLRDFDQNRNVSKQFNCNPSPICSY